MNNLFLWALIAEIAGTIAWFGSSSIFFANCTPIPYVSQRSYSCSYLPYLRQYIKILSLSTPPRQKDIFAILTPEYRCNNYLSKACMSDWSCIIKNDLMRCIEYFCLVFLTQTTIYSHLFTSGVKNMRSAFMIYCRTYRHLMSPERRIYEFVLT